jgi:hypothetical protein
MTMLTYDTETACNDAGRSLAALLQHHRWLRCGLLGVISVAGSLTTSWLVGITMNHVFTQPLIRLL